MSGELREVCEHRMKAEDRTDGLRWERSGKITGIVIPARFLIIVCLWANIILHKEPQSIWIMTESIAWLRKMVSHVRADWEVHQIMSGEDLDGLSIPKPIEIFNVDFEGLVAACAPNK